MKISVITVCKNDKKGLENTFKSLCSQDSKAFEWWVIDGDSSDDSVEWLKRMHTLDGGWRSEPDNGIYDAMNKGIGLAGGDYLLFMNSGDMLAGPDVISKLVNQIGQQKAAPDFVFGDALDVEESGRSHYRKARSHAHIKIGMPTRHQSMLYRRECIFHERYPLSFKLSSDYALTANLLVKGDIKVLKVNFPICLFSLGGTHDTHRFKALYEDFTIRRAIMQENLATCVLLFCVHLLHHSARTLAPSLNRIFIYRS